MHFMFELTDREVKVIGELQAGNRAPAPARTGFDRANQHRNNVGIPDRAYRNKAPARNNPSIQQERAACGAGRR